MASGNALFEFFDNKLVEIINKTLEDFITSTDCCIAFPKYFTSKHRLSVHNYAQKKILKNRNHQKDGIKHVKVYKICCNTYLQPEEPVKLTEISKILIFNYLKKNPLTQKEKIDDFPYAKKSAFLKSKLPIYRFCVGTIHNAMLSVPPNLLGSSGDRFSLPIHKYKEEILIAVEEFQTVILAGDIGYELSNQVPQFIVEESVKNQRHCRIISAHNNRISAINDSIKVATQRGERLGQTVGFQLRLESMSNTTTNILYTTISFFLRCMLGKIATNFLHGVTHIIINDIHERQSDGDILFLELKEVINLYPSLKIILTCNTTNTMLFTNYFHYTKLVQLENLNHAVGIYYLDQILHLVPHKKRGKSGKIITCDPSIQQVFQNYLEVYMDTGNRDAFDYIFYLFEEENLPINIQHSKTGITLLMAAMRNNHLKQVVQLLKLKVDMFLLDHDRRSALVWGKMFRSQECVEYLNQEIFKYLNEINKLDNLDCNEILLEYYDNANCGEKAAVDHDLIFDLINYLNDCGEKGTILVFLPTFEDLVKQKHIINSNLSSGVMKSNIKLYLLHKCIVDVDIKHIIDDCGDFRKIVLATHVAESALFVKNIRFVIDSGKISMQTYETNYKKHKLSWISQDKMLRRTSIIDYKQSGYCFRLFSKKEADNFSLEKKPKILYEPLHKICLYIKLLSRNFSVNQYFESLINRPPRKNIEDSLRLLKSIGALDERGNITLLGIRLVDIPVDLQLGKVLLFAIILRCLDPVVTIVSALLYKDPFVLPDDLSAKQEIILTRKNLAESTNSDHLVLLRIYQNWQNSRVVPENASLQQLILNELLAAICDIRTEIIGSLRAARLIHSKGLLSMKSINTNSNNWALVKTCFIAGMYPNICKIDNLLKEIKSNFHQKVIPHQGSVLRDLNPLSVTKLTNSYQTNWILFQDNHLKETLINIEFNSLVTPVSVALFGGASEMLEEDLSNEHEPFASTEYLNCVHFNLDEWLSIAFSPEHAYLLFSLKQRFFSFFKEILHECSEFDKFYRAQKDLEEKSVIIDLIAKIILLEENAYDFPKPWKVGERPKALPLRENFNSPQSFADIQSSPNICGTFPNANISRFYILKISSKNQVENIFNEPQQWENSYPIWRYLIEEYYKSPETNTIIFLLTNDTKDFCGAGEMMNVNGVTYLKKMVQANVPFREFQNLCCSVGEEYQTCSEGVQLPRIIGEYFLAYLLQRAQ